MSTNSIDNIVSISGKCALAFVCVSTLGTTLGASTAFGVWAASHALSKAELRAIEKAKAIAEDQSEVDDRELDVQNATEQSATTSKPTINKTTTLRDPSTVNFILDEMPLNQPPEGYSSYAPSTSKAESDALRAEFNAQADAANARRMTFAPAN